MKLPARVLKDGTMVGWRKKKREKKKKTRDITQGGIMATYQEEAITSAM